VGEKKLIRIDEVKRTAAYASLVSDNGAGAAGSPDRYKEAEEQPAPSRGRARRAPQREAVTAGTSDASNPSDAGEEPEEAPAKGDDKQVQSNGSTGKRRRGRRGGRRRSRARADKGSAG
jgi:hypothetical protein